MCSARRVFVLADTFAICRLDKVAQNPSWLSYSNFTSVTRTNEELSVICREKDVPANVAHTGGWRCLKIEGPFDLDSIGVLMSVAAPLSENTISIFVVATYDTDYILIKNQDLTRAVEILKQRNQDVLGYEG